MSSRSSISLEVESSLRIGARYGSIGGLGACTLLPPTKVDTDNNLPSRMTLPQPKPEPGASVTDDFASASAGDALRDWPLTPKDAFDPFLFLEVVESDGEIWAPFSDVGVASDSCERDGKCCSSLGRFRESFLTNDGR